MSKKKANADQIPLPIVGYQIDNEVISQRVRDGLYQCHIAL
jgi:hypothetical protein